MECAIERKMDQENAMKTIIRISKLKSGGSGQLRKLEIHIAPDGIEGTLC